MVTMTNPMQWFLALIIGSFIFSILFFVLKKPVDYDEVRELKIEDEKEVDLSDLKMT